MLTDSTLHSFLISLTAEGLSENTRTAYKMDALSFLTWRLTKPATPTWKDTEALAAEYLNDGRTTWSPKTTIRRRGTLRRWAEFDGCPFTFLSKYRAPAAPPAVPHPLPEGIQGVYAMIASTSNPKHKALCALTGLVGLRVDEAVNVEPSHINLHERSVTVCGKGEKTRIVPLSDRVLEIIMPAYRHAAKNNTTLVDLSQSGARKSIRRHGKRAGLSRPVASHDMRATAATEMYARTKDIRAVQEILGHSDVRTTQGYTMISEAAKRAALESLA